MISIDMECLKINGYLCIIYLKLVHKNGLICLMPLLIIFVSLHLSSVQSLSRVWHFVTPWTKVWQASLYIPNSQSLFKLMSIELVMPSNHLILCHPTISSSVIPFSSSQHHGLFKWVSSSHHVAKVLEFQLQHQSFQWIFRTDFL